MKRFVLLFSIIMLFNLNTWAQDYDLLFYQPYFNGGFALGSYIYSPDGTNWESAENFSGLQDDISQMIIYGFCFTEGFIPVPPAETEPVIVRFYEFEEGFAPGLFAETSGEYSLELYDDYGDGWNGGLISLSVNDSIVFEDLTLADGSGPDTYSFTVNTGDEISTEFIPGEWANECYYRILDDSGNMIAEDGGTMENMWISVPEGILPAGTPITPEPNWDNPLNTFNMDATSEYVGIVWDDLPLYKFVMDFDPALNMEQGWVSFQMNSDAGSGVQFFWLCSTVGDGFCQTNERNGRDKDRSAVNRILLLSDTDNRDEEEGDLSLELWGGVLSHPPSAVSNVFPLDGMINLIQPCILSWFMTPIADGYKINFGTNNPPTNIEYNVDLGNITQYEAEELLTSTQHYWQIIPYNEFGDATDCPVWTFITAPSGYVFLGDPLSTQTNTATPFCVSWETSLTETLYRAEWLEAQGVTSGNLNTISFFYSYVEDSPNIAINVWVGETEIDELPLEWIPATELNQVFSGTVDLFAGDHELIIDLTAPYNYRGNNLVVMIEHPYDEVIYDWDNQFYVSYPNENINISLIDLATSPVLDPYSPTPVEYYAPFFPNTSLRFDVTSIQEDNYQINSVYVLKGNYPNPFNPVTLINFNVNRQTNVKIDIYNLKGQKVRSLVDDIFMSGIHTLEWNGKDDNQRDVSSGVYLYKMIADKYTSTKKMLLLK